MAYKDVLAAGVISGLLVASSADASTNPSPNSISAMDSPTFPTQLVPKSKLERCYGISKRGQNDCGTATHACANQSTSDNNPQEWIYVLKGNCTRITGGSLDPIEKINPVNQTNQQVIQDSNSGSNEILY